MDRAAAIHTNHKALIRIVAALIAMAGVTEGGAAARLPKALYYAVLRVLRPAESAVRRLIVIAACELKLKLPPVRSMPKGLALARARGKRVTFQLFDTRKRFLFTPRKIAAGPDPRVHVFGANPFGRLVQVRPVGNPVTIPAPDDDDDRDALPLSRRLTAIKLALDNVPGQARRMARWQARRARMPGFIFRSPLRPSRPPGHREEPVEEIDGLLDTCHALAWEALNPDTS